MATLKYAGRLHRCMGILAMFSNEIWGNGAGAGEYSQNGVTILSVTKFWHDSDSSGCKLMCRVYLFILYIYHPWQNSDIIMTKFWQNSDMPFWTVLTGPLLENSQCQVLPEIKGSFPRTVDEECMEGLSEEERADFLQAKEQQESCIKRFLGFEETLLMPKQKNMDCDVAVDSGHRSCSLGDVWQRTRVVEFRIGRKRGLSLRSEEKCCFAHAQRTA